MYRDDEYLRLMLALIAKFCVNYVRQGKPPPLDMFYSSDELHQLMHRTKSLAYRAEIVAKHLQPIVPPGADANSFW
jgi:hypothetical protein